MKFLFTFFFFLKKAKALLRLWEGGKKRCTEIILEHLERIWTHKEESKAHVVGTLAGAKCSLCSILQTFNLCFGKQATLHHGWSKGKGAVEVWLQVTWDPKTNRYLFWIHLYYKIAMIFGYWNILKKKNLLLSFIIITSHWTSDSHPFLASTLQWKLIGFAFKFPHVGLLISLNILLAILCKLHFSLKSKKEKNSILVPDNC